MSVRDWDIFGQVERLRRELSRAAADFPSPSGSARRVEGWTPAVDIHERDDSLLLSFDLPGVTRDEIHLQVDAESLTVEGERRRDTESRHIRLERPVGRFRRSFQISMPIDPSGVRAAYRDGVLEVNIPKVAPAAPMRVRVEVE